jgi:lipopolysaccharide/colanic/teichoic acid biosynthesis glycosyltransferase
MSSAGTAALTAADPITLPRPALPGWKRALDVAAASVLLVLTAPVLLLVLVLVRLDGGPVLFRQRRIGTGGRTIQITKVRTMHVDAEDRLAVDPVLRARHRSHEFKLPLDEDPRITRWGHLLRASSLDELPQLLSVLRGDMTMVGPRPIVAAELDEYRERGAADAYLACRPGLTGRWQVSGDDGRGYDRRIALDLDYLTQPTFVVDLRIIVRTAAVVSRGALAREPGRSLSRGRPASR